MVNRLIAISTMLCAIGFAWSYTIAQTGRNAKANGDITALQQQRTRLLTERVSKIQEFHDAKFVDRSELFESQIDLINAQLDHAGSNIEKRQLLTSVMKMDDEQIRLVELALEAPQIPAKAGERPEPHGLAEMSTILFLKSERIRVEIERDTLE